MTLVNIDLRNQGYETSPGDRVVFYSLLVREGDFGTISTAPVEVELVDGKASVDLTPGPVGVQIIAGQVADTRVKEGRVPMEGPTTLNVVLTLFPEYSDAIRSQFLAAIHQAQDTALTRIDAEVAVAVDAEVGEFKTKAEQALTKSTAAESKSDAALSKSTTAESSTSNAVSRVEALEVMGGLTPGEPVDGQTANLIEQPGTLTRGVLDGAYATPEFYVGRFGDIGGEDDSPAVNAALVAATTRGGVVTLPPGTVNISSTIVVPQGVTLRGSGKNINSGVEGTSLRVAAGVDGVRLAGSMAGLENLTVTSREVGNGTSKGVIIDSNYASINRVTVRRFGSHAFYSSSADGGNRNMARLYDCRANLNGGAGLYIEGHNSNANMVLGFDSTANTGDGIYCDSSRNWFFGGHVSGNKGRAAYDDGISNTWNVYFETPAEFHIGPGGTHGILESLHYSMPTVVGDTVPLLSWRIWERGSFRGQIGIHDRGGHSTGSKFSLRSVDGALTLNNETESRIVFGVDSDNSRIRMGTSVVPTADHTSDLGRTLGWWRDVFVSRAVRFKQVDVLPTAGSLYRGQLRWVEGGAGDADRLVVCRKSADGTYAWVDTLS